MSRQVGRGVPAEPGSGSDSDGNARLGRRRSPYP